MKKKIGKVYLVGAGPGDARLITVRGKQLLRSADVVLYDALINRRLLEEVKDSAEKIFVGKVSEQKEVYDMKPSGVVSQEKINQLIAKKAKQGKEVVRLKGGDPLIFARGGEEAEYLLKQKIAVEFVPGVTAALSAFAALGVSATHRDHASQIIFVTGHEDPKKEKSSLDYQALAKIKGTLVFYMGIGRLKKICQELISNGKSNKTPVIVARWITTPLEQWVEGTLSNIDQKVKKAKLTSPCLIIVGEVVKNALRKKLKQERPLLGKRVLVTRAKSQSSSLKNQLQDLGAEVVSMPMFQFKEPTSWKPVDLAIKKLDQHHYDWVIFTSHNGIIYFDQRLEQQKKDWRVLSQAKVACVGEATRKVLRQMGVRADLVPKKYVAEALFQELKRKEKLKGKRVLLLRGNLARPYLNQALKKEGALVDEAVVYHTVAEKKPVKALVEQVKRGDVDFIPFTSSSNVDHFFNFVSNGKSRKLTAKIISIGPMTSKTIKSYGMKVHKQSDPHTVEGIVKSIVLLGKGKQ